MELASGDDGIHADSALTIKGGTLNVTESYEGLESQVITINDGTIHLFTSDDGINATSGGGDMGGGMRGGMDNFGASDNYVYIHGGYLYMDANGDGLDSNGNFEMTNGVVLVNGPTNNGNGPLDYMSSFKISGGFLVAVGSAGMAQAPSDDSTQYAVLQILDNMQAAGTMIHIETAAGENVLTFLLTKEYQSILISSSVLQNGESYTLFIGGSSSGTPVDGLYTDGTYTPGTQAANFTITSIITGGGGGMFPGGGPGGRRPGGGGVPAGPPPPQP
ncbi:MAG: carbohydrate-binding domain-containing protein [Anaerolineales bacterium]